MSETLSDQIVEDKEAEPISFQSFLETVHPSRQMGVVGLWMQAQGVRKLQAPAIRLHCKSDSCNGIRTFRSFGPENYITPGKPETISLDYLCSDCRRSFKRYALQITPAETVGRGTVYKYGEMPAFGVPVPNRLLRIFGDQDSKLFLKGRQCENQGFGIGAFAYYRRVVEHHKSDIFDGIINVCETVGAPAEMIAELQKAKEEISFSKAIDTIKPAIPQGLLINGHNPLSLLHSALSIGLHSETDETCLEAAQDIRTVLGELVERISSLRKNDVELNGAVQRLIAKRNKQDKEPS